jgi:ubiquitin-conjugating enzyme E2 J1
MVWMFLTKEWHFTLRGPPAGGFKGGRYHGRIIFPSDYPFKPPDFMFLTPNGRFEVGKKICLNISGYHTETWRPVWGVRTALIAIISFFLQKGEGSVGALDWPEEERVKCAKASSGWSCKVCKTVNGEVLPTDEEVPGIIFEVNQELSLKLRDDVAPVGELADRDTPETELIEKKIETTSIGDELCLDQSTQLDCSPAMDVQPSSVDSSSSFNTLWNIDLALLCIFIALTAWILNRFK